jgi:hypothetical protein
MTGNYWVTRKAIREENKSYMIREIKIYAEQARRKFAEWQEYLNTNKKKAEQ